MDWSSIRQSFWLSGQSFTDGAVNIMAVARREAKERQHLYVAPEHVLLATAKVEHGMGAAVLERLGLNLRVLDHDLAELVAAVPERPSNAKLVLGSQVEEMLGRANEQSRALGHKYVGTEHLMLALLAGDDQAAEFLKGYGITAEPFKEEVLRLLGKPRRSWLSRVYSRR